MFKELVSPPTKEIPLALNEDLLGKYVKDALARVGSSFVDKAVESGEIERLGTSTIIIKDELHQKEAV